MSQKSSAQRVKVLLIPLLAALLLAVVFWPTAEEDSAAALAEGAPGEARPSALGPADVAAAPNTPDAYDLAWAAIDRSQVQRFNPFAAPSVKTKATNAATPSPSGGTLSAVAPGSPSLPEKTSAPARTTLKVQAVIERDAQFVALIDGQIAAAGDTLRDGSVIVSVTPDSVIVQPK